MKVRGPREAEGGVGMNCTWIRQSQLRRHGESLKKLKYGGFPKTGALFGESPYQKLCQGPSLGPPSGNPN